MSRRPEPIELDRTQVRRVAGAIEALRVQHGTLGDAADAVGVKVDWLGRIWRQPAATSTARGTSIAVASARGQARRAIGGAMTGRAQLYAVCVESEVRAAGHRAAAALRLEEGDVVQAERAAKLAAHFQARARLYLRCWEAAAVAEGSP